MRISAEEDHRAQRLVHRVSPVDRFLPFYISGWLTGRSHERSAAYANPILDLTRPSPRSCVLGGGMRSARSAVLAGECGRRVDRLETRSNCLRIRSVSGEAAYSTSAVCPPDGPPL